MLEKTLESKLDDYFAIVPKELFEEAQEQAFQEMDSDECTEDQCILMIKEILQIENAFKMDIMYEDGDTQISITWNDQDQKRVEEDYCEGCKTKGLRLMIGGLVENLVGNQVVAKPVVVVEKRQKEVLFNNNINHRGNYPYHGVWDKDGDEETDNKYVGEIENSKPNGKGTLNYSDGTKYVGEWKNGEHHGNGTKVFGKGKWEGEKYVGLWKDGLRHGHGTYTWNMGKWKGDKFVGEYKNGKRNGYGTFSWNTGDKYVGEYKNGNKSNGTLYNKNGNITGKYVNGKYIEQ